MRTGEHDHEEKTALLKCANEEIYDGVRQPCCRCGGVAIWHPAQLPHIFLDQPLQKGSVESIEMGTTVVEFSQLRFRRASGDSAVAVQWDSDRLCQRIGEVLGSFEFTFRV